MTGFKRLVFSVCFLTLFQTLVYSKYVRLEILKIFGAPYEDGKSIRSYVLSDKPQKLFLVIIALALLQIPCLFFGDLITETMFVWQGVGRLGYEAIKNKDHSVLIGVGMLGLMLTFVSNFLADVLFFSLESKKEDM